MVNKGSKLGLNTGNTIRHCHRGVLLRQCQRYAGLVVYQWMGSVEDECWPIIDKILDLLPFSERGDHPIEFSLNKQNRWNIPEYLVSVIEQASDNTDLQIVLMGHMFSVAGPDNFNHNRREVKEVIETDWRSMDQWNTCTSYFSNVGKVRELINDTKMSIDSATRGHEEVDHISKAERRQQRLARHQQTNYAQRRSRCVQRRGHKPRWEDEEEVYEKSLPLYECHVGYGPENNGRFYKDLATKGLTYKPRRKKRYAKDHHGLCLADITLPLHRSASTRSTCSSMRYTDVDDDSCDDIYSTDISEDRAFKPITASLNELISATLNRSKLRRSYTYRHRPETPPPTPPIFLTDLIEVKMVSRTSLRSSRKSPPDSYISHFIDY